MQFTYNLKICFVCRERLSRKWLPQWCTETWIQWTQPCFHSMQNFCHPCCHCPRRLRTRAAIWHNKTWTIESLVWLPYDPVTSTPVARPSVCLMAAFCKVLDMVQFEKLYEERNSSSIWLGNFSDQKMKTTYKKMPV